MPSHKNFQQALNDITIINLQIVLNTQNNLYVNQTAEKILAKIFLLKQIQESKIEIRSTPLPPHARWGLERACQHLKIAIVFQIVLNQIQDNFKLTSGISMNHH